MIDLLLGLAIGIVFTLLAGRIARERREGRELEARQLGRQWGGPQ